MEDLTSERASISPSDAEVEQQFLALHPMAADLCLEGFVNRFLQEMQTASSQLLSKHREFAQTAFKAEMVRFHRQQSSLASGSTGGMQESAMPSVWIEEARVEAPPQVVSPQLSENRPSVTNMLPRPSCDAWVSTLQPAPSEGKMRPSVRFGTDSDKPAPSTINEVDVSPSMTSEEESSKLPGSMLCTFSDFGKGGLNHGSGRSQTGSFSRAFTGTDIGGTGSQNLRSQLQSRMSVANHTPVGRVASEDSQCSQRHPRPAAQRGSQLQSIVSSEAGSVVLAPIEHVDSVSKWGVAALLGKKDPEAGPPGGMFRDMAEVKDKIHDLLHEREYSVTRYYKTTGIWQHMARHIWFENLTMGVIIINTFYLAVDAEWNEQAQLIDAHIGFKVAENFFCSYYFSELMIRFLAFEESRHCMMDGWFVFDSFLVVTVVFETWILTFFLLVIPSLNAEGMNGAILRIFRLLRLTKVLRMVRILKLMPELLVLTKGLAVALHSVFFTFVLLMAVVYVFVIVFKQLTAGDDIGQEYFASVPDGMATLLLKATFPDVAQLVIRFGNSNIFYGGVLMLFIFIASLLVLNMLVGVLVEVVSFVSRVEKEQLQVSWVTQELQKIAKKYGIGGGKGKLLTREDFVLLLTMPEAVRVIRQLGVDVLGLVDFSDFFFRGTDVVPFGDFMELILQLRGSNKATVKDVVDLRRHMITELVEIKELIDSMLASGAGRQWGSQKSQATAMQSSASRVGMKASDLGFHSMGGHRATMTSQ